MGKPAAPQAPDPAALAQQQTQSNIQTAVAQSNLNAIDQVNPTGSLKYAEIGKNSDGTPKLQATTTYSPGAQNLFDTGMQTQQNLATLGKDQSAKLSGLLSTPFNLDGLPAAGNATPKDYSADRTKVEDALFARLNPQIERDRTTLDTKLSNQGIKLGSTAYDRAQDDFGRNVNDARTSVVLNAGQEQNRMAQLDAQDFSQANTARNLALTERYAQRQAPINEIIGLTSGTQLQTPQFANTPQSSVAGTDTAGLATNAYNQNYNTWLQAQNQNNSLLGGLFGLGSAAIIASDRRLKTAIQKIGELANGLNVYTYRYKGRAETHTGVMADEVARIMPKALRWLPSGFYGVDYDMVLEAA